MMNFMWDFSDENFKKLCDAQKAGATGDDAWDREFLGACFVGNYKFEIFVNTAGGWYEDTLIKATYLQKDNSVWDDVLEDGTPYGFFPSIDIELPRRRTIGKFMEEFERRVMDYASKRRGLFEKAAELPTLPYHWYEGMKYQPVIVREVMYE